MFKTEIVLLVIVFIIGLNVIPGVAYLTDKQYNAEYLKDNYYLNKSIDCSTSSKNWTWMFYNDADFYNGFDPFEWFTEEAFSGEKLDVIMLQDTYGGPAYYWYIDENHNAVLLEDLGEVDMGEFQTLIDFINYSKDNFPAERYLLSFYDHGGGWTGACVDDTDSGWLTMNEMQKALSEAGGVDIVCFTAPCLMGAFESVYEIKDYIDVYIGSEEGSGYAWWGYIISDICDILEEYSDIDTVTLGEHIIDLIWMDHDRWDYKEAITMSAIRSDKMEDLGNFLDKAAYDFVDKCNVSYDKIWSIYEDVQFFGNGGILDIYDFADKYYSVETDPTICQDLINIMNCLSDAVIAECHGTDHPDAHGLTIYFPSSTVDYDYTDLDYGLDFTRDTFWDEFLVDFLYEAEDPDIDQIQNELSTYFLLCGNWIWGQSFIPSSDLITRVKLFIKRSGDISTDVTVSIRNSRTGEDLTSVSIPYDKISINSLEWIEFDFKDIEVTPGETYYILCSTLGGDNQANYYTLGGSNNFDSYPYGDVWIRWALGSWQKWDPPMDLCFKTYSANKAPTISGRSSGKINEEYQYSFSYIDPFGEEDVFYYIEWGDGDIQDWIGPYKSGKEISFNHTWTNKGYYSIRAKAKNINGIESDWATLEVSMPKNRPLTNRPILRIFTQLLDFLT